MNKFFALIMSASFVVASVQAADVSVALPTENGSAVAWVKKHKVALIAAATVVTTGSAAYYFRNEIADNSYVKSAIEKATAAWQATQDATVAAYDATKEATVSAYDATKGATVAAYDATKDAAVFAYNNPKDAAKNTYTYSKDAVLNNKMITAGLTASVIVAVLAYKDLKKEDEESFIKSFYARLLAMAKKQDATQAAQ